MPDAELVEKVEKYEEEIQDLKKKNIRKDDIVVFYKERYDNLEAQFDQYKESQPV
jgi:predicted RNase H-like nuclease (RuvC/YqgF family)